MIIVSDIVSLRERGKYQGILGASLGIGNVIGPFIAAAFIMKSTWRGFFWLISPLSACSIVVGYFLIPNNTRKDGFRENLRRIDFFGIIASSIGIIFLLIPISGGGSYFEWNSPMVISMLVIGGCSLIAFLFIEWKVAILPMLPMVLFKNKVVCALFLQSFLLGAVYQSYLYYLPLYYQNVREWSPIVSAALTSPLVFCQSLVSVLSGQYISRLKRYGEVIWCGFGFWTLGAGLILLFDRTTNPGVIAVVVAIVGIGVGNVFQPTLVAFQAHCTKSQRAVVISNRNFFRCLGGACGLAVSAALLQATLKSNLPDGFEHLAHSTYSLPSRASVSDAEWSQILTAYAKASRSVFILQVPLIGLCFIACIFIRDRGLERPKEPGEEEEERKKQDEGNVQEAGIHAESQVAKSPDPVAGVDQGPARPELAGRYTHALEERIKDLESQLTSRQLGASGNGNDTAAHPATPALFPPPSHDAVQPSPSPATGIDHNAVGELVGFLALNSYEAPAYVGSSSGLSLAANLGEMVQATVWNQVLAPSRGQQHPLNLFGGAPGGGAPTTNGPRGNGGPSRSLRMEDLIAKSTEPPNDEMGARILQAYLTRLHVRYTFLDRHELWRLHESRFRLAKAKREELSQAERFGIFKLYLVYAIGATTLELSEKYTYVPAERFYMTALQQVPAMCEARSIENIEAMTLLVVYHLRSASSQGVWYMVGLAMRTAIDLGLHRKANETSLDPITAQMRRRLFWTVYYLERVVSMSLGRPFSIADRHIDLPLPMDVDDDVRDPALLSTSTTSSPAPPNRITTLTFAIYLIRLRRIDSKIQHKIYRADRPLHSLRSKMDALFLELEEWKESALLRFHGPDLDYPILHYNRALRLLIQPFLPSLPLSDPYYHVCLRAAGNICQTHKRLHQTLEYGHSFLAVQTVFMAGITLLYALWTHAHDVWSVQMSNDIRACSTVLFVMGERAVWVKKYRDAFELLVNAAMEKLEVNDPSRKIGMAELMTAQHSGSLANPPSFSPAPGPGIFKHPYPNLTANPTAQPPTPAVNLNPHPGSGIGPGAGIRNPANSQPQNHQPQPSDSTNPTDPLQNHGMRMAFQLAPWIDLEEDSPFWMPDFETLESLSGDLNFWNVGAPGPFEPL
ncbi:C6 transcription factor [Aspergillus steynii IBT 23096]|uniref:C6 transcription factor n=1 Tax=Aspergillus steynii IBT 23096 TaxID=1392250 RepID=A0A2I2G2H6_9EURO|nr:C6 transcription factor [Aspergillus steynii IBT 23096]PLB47082.1 C6 transcription factor [Aspergillus steynii IBT 23096]